MLYLGFHIILHEVFQNNSLLWIFHIMISKYGIYLNIVFILKYFYF